jgi:hypothetical protein
MGQHRLDHDLRIALLAEDRRPVLRVLVERGVNLVVEVVQEPDGAPERLVLTVATRVEAQAGLDGECVAAQRLALRVRRQRLPRPLASDFPEGG